MNRICVLVFALAALAGAARAETQQENDWCYGATATDDQTIEGCTAMLQSGKYSGDVLSRIYNNLGVGYAGKKEWDMAIQNQLLAVRLDPTNAQAFHNLGANYAKKGDYQTAIADFDQAIRLKPDYAKAFYGRGLARQQIGDAAGGAADIAAARQIDPNIGK